MHGRTGPTVGEPDAEYIATAVLSVAAVAGLHGGAFGEVATYLPGRRVTGVRVTDDGVWVHVVGRYPVPVAVTVAAVRAAVAPHASGLPVHVTVEDLFLPADPADGGGSEPGGHPAGAAGGAREPRGRRHETESSKESLGMLPGSA